MTDVSEITYEFPQLSTARKAALWGGGAVAAAAVAVAALAPAAAGPTGLVFLGGVAIGGAILLYGLTGGAGRLVARARGGDGADTVAADAFDAMIDPALITDRSGAPLRANRAYRELAEEAGAMGDSGRPPAFDRVLGGHPGVAAGVYRLARAAGRGESVRERLPLAPVGVNGPARGFDLDVAPLPGGDALWRAHERLDEDARTALTHDALVDEAPIGFFSAASDGRILYMNATMREWLGDRASQDDLRLKDIVVGDAARALGRAGRPSAGPVRAEATLRARDGIETPVVIVSSWPETGEKSASRSIVFGLTPVAAPPGVAQALAAPSTEAGGLLDAMFANAPFGVARLSETDPQRAVLEDANPALVHVTAGAATPGARFAELFVDEPAGIVAERLAEAGHGAGASPVELSLAALEEETLTGRAPRPREVHVYFAHDRAGRMAAYIVDVAEAKEIERQFHRAQRINAIGLLAGKIAHDFNNFLTTIQLAAGELLEAHPVGDPDYNTLTRISQSVNRGASVVRHLKNFASEQTVVPEPIEVGELLSDFSVLLRHAVEENMRLELTHGRDVPLIRADRGQIENVIMNLVTNARDAMSGRGGGVLTIATRRAEAAELRDARVDDVVDAPYAVIEVSDTGAGMSPDILEKIFEPYFTTKPEDKGTGLGLASVFGIVKQSNGHVLVESAVGEGTTFRLYFPEYELTDDDVKAQAAARERIEQAAARPKALSGGGRILLVEDEHELRWFSAKLLRKRGYEVVEAGDGMEALDILEEDPGAFDLILTDVVMPELAGPEFIKEAGDLIGDARVVFMSGYAKQDFSETLSRDLSVGYLPKPFTNEQLAEKVKTELGG